MDEKQKPLNQSQIPEPQTTPQMQVVGSGGVTQQLPQKQSFFRLNSPSRNSISTLIGINFGVVLAALLLQWYINVYGTERSVLMALLLVPFMLLGFFAVVCANVIYIPLYLIKSKPTIGHAILATVTLLVSLGVVGFYAYLLTHPTHYATQSTVGSYSQTGKSQAARYDETTKDKALQLMNDCRVGEFVGYNGDISLVDKNGKDGIQRAEKSATGISAYMGGASYPTVMYASKTLTPELLPSARLAREKCAGQKELRVYVDNTLEVKASDGSWRTVTAP